MVMRRLVGAETTGRSYSLPDTPDGEPVVPERGETELWTPLFDQPTSHPYNQRFRDRAQEIILENESHLSENEVSL
jgi:hypothetical protein